MPSRFIAEALGVEGSGMKYRPILFSGEMVRALLAGTKTQTRRIVKPQPVRVEPHNVRLELDRAVHVPAGWAWRDMYAADSKEGAFAHDLAAWHSPYGVPGDVLYVRETFQIALRDTPEGAAGPSRIRSEGGPMTIHEVPVYRASETPEEIAFYRWKPGIHLPKWAARLFLRVTAVRAERLDEITIGDVRAEGVNMDGVGNVIQGIARYQVLWESINGAGSWDANPWVWVVTFERTERPDGWPL